MSITKIEKNTEAYLRKISHEPHNTFRGKELVAKKWTNFTLEHHSLTPEKFAEELLLIKKKDSEEEYEDILFDQLQEFVNELNSNPNSVKTTFSYLRPFLYHLGIKISDQDKKMRLKFPKIQKEEKYALSQDELRKIILDLSHYPKRQALILACSSSGMRQGEAVQVIKSDMTLVDNRYKVILRSEITKTKTSRTVFFSDEAKEKIDTYIDDLKSDDCVLANGNVCVKSRCAAEHKALTRSLERLGIEMKYTSNGYHKITFHSFRAYFFTKAVRMHGENYAHRMTGHSGYLMEYDRMTEDEKLEWYLKLEPELSIFDITKEKIKNEKLKKEQTSQFKEMKGEIQSLKVLLSKQDDEKISKLIRDGIIKFTHSPFSS